MIYEFNFIACGCQTPGSKSNACDNNGKCTCSTGYDGDKCSKCKSSYYKTLGGCSGTSVMVDFMCLSLQKAVVDFCMIQKVLGSVCSHIFGNILEISAHYFWEH